MSIMEKMLQQKAATATKKNSIDELD